MEVGAVFEVQFDETVGFVKRRVSSFNLGVWWAGIPGRRSTLLTIGVDDEYVETFLAGGEVPGRINGREVLLRGYARPAP